MRRTNPWKELERLAKGAQRAQLVPALGSGFVTQAAIEGAHPLRPPAAVDWPEILRGVATEFSCKRAAALIERDVPGQTTLLWDSMLGELAGKGPGAASAWERKLRRSVARRLRQDTTMHELTRPFVDSFLQLGWNDVMCFNFDNVLLPRAVKPTHRVRSAARRASLVAQLSKSPKPVRAARLAGPRKTSSQPKSGSARVWFPHGHQSDPDSIVLGAHAYGLRLAAMQAAFDDHARAPAPRPADGLDTWVATALERPLLFIGLSLTREEWTVWWLLSQRARFLARRPAEKKPPAFVFAIRPSTHDKLELHAAFHTLARACELLDLRLLEFSDFRTGWGKLRSALGWKS